MRCGTAGWVPPSCTVKPRTESRLPGSYDAVVLLRGRDRELDSLQSSLAAVPDGTGVGITLRGAPGMGKSALLDRIPGLLPGRARVLRVTGASAESALPFASVHQLLHPLRTRVDRLPPPQAAALGAVFGFECADPDPYLLRIATLSLLSDVAAERPLLVLADDADRLDQASAEILAFVARRLPHERIAFVAALSGDGPVVATGDEVVLAPLTEESLRAVVADRYPDAPDAVLSRLAADADGNPGVAVELAAALTESQRRGTVPLPDALTMRGPLGTTFARALLGLPGESRALLLVAAAAGAADPGAELPTVLAAARELRIGDDALDPPLAAGLVSTAGGEVVFRPRALRSLVYQTAPRSERVRAHQVLAGVSPPGGRANLMHRALSAVDTDDELAAALAADAGELAAAGAHRAAAETLHRAVGLTADARLRASYLVGTAEYAWRAGEPYALALLPCAELDADASTRARVAHLRSLAELVGGSLSTARRLLFPIVHAGAEPALAVRIRATLTHCAWLDDDGTPGVESGGPHTTAGWPPGDDGSGLSVVPAFLAAVEAGRWDVTKVAVRAALRAAEERGQGNAVCVLRALLAMLAALSGRTEECERIAAAVLDDAHRRGLRWPAAVSRWSVGLAALGEGRARDAVTCLLGLAGPGAPHHHSALAVASAPDLVEALVRSGRTEEAKARLGALARDESPVLGVDRTAIVARCEAIVAEDAAGALFERALEHVVHTPLVAARTRLLYGEWLRRARKIGPARDQLRAAQSWFELAGGSHWANRCQAELRATGQCAQHVTTIPAADGLAALTPRQLQIVRSAAAGRSNQEIAAELFISPRTVSDHLYKLFPKLGVSSRRQLWELRAELRAEGQF